MPGRNAKPLGLHLIYGNKRHLTKAEIKARQESEIHFGTHEFKPSKQVKRNKAAYKKWKELIALYTTGGADFVTTSDAGLLERYCLAYAEYLNLQEVRREIEAHGWDKVKTYHAIDELHLESNINKKLELLLKMDAQLFLTPLSKVKSVMPKPANESADPLAQEGFGNV